jgi:hypothetical protein
MGQLNSQLAQGPHHPGRVVPLAHHLAHGPVPDEAQRGALVVAVQYLNLKQIL